MNERQPLGVQHQPRMLPAPAVETIADDRRPDPERVGMFTTAILCITNMLPILLFYTGRKYAGENLATLLEARAPRPPV